MTGARRRRAIASRAAFRSAATSWSVELTKTRSRWSGVRMLGMAPQHDASPTPIGAGSRRGSLCAAHYAHAGHEAKRRHPAADLVTERACRVVGAGAPGPATEKPGHAV